MSNTPSPLPLLPSGLRDRLAPDAGYERYITNTLLDRFALFGYRQVSPPLLEFEETLFAGKGQAHAANSFRVMDAVSQKMMAIRADITTQIERLALRLPPQESPIRLSYAGNVLRALGTVLRQDRQLRQAGIEMIGASISLREVMTATIEALTICGLKHMVITLSSASANDALFGSCDERMRADITKALHHKNPDALPDNTPYKEEIIALMQDSRNVLPSLPDILVQELDEMTTLSQALQSDFGDLVTLLSDMLDADGFDYHQGMCFTIIDAHSRQEVARGGCYRLNERLQGCGATIYIERLMESDLVPQAEPEQQHIPASMPYGEAKALRDASIMTLMKETNYE